MNGSDTQLDEWPGSEEVTCHDPSPFAAPVTNEVVPRAEVEALKDELDMWRGRAAALDAAVFEMRALLQSGKGFSEILDTDELLAALMAVARERTAAVSSAVLLLDDLDPDRVFYRVRAFHALPSSYLGPEGTPEELMLFRLPRNEGLLWQLVHQGDVFSVRDMYGRSRFPTAFSGWRLDVLGSDVWVPLVRGGSVVGILTLGPRPNGSPISEGAFRFLHELAAVAATNIDSTLKYERNQQILRNLRILYDVNRQLDTVHDFKRLTERSLETAVEALGAQKANLMLYDDEKDLLEIRVVAGPGIPEPTRAAINSGLQRTRSFRLGAGVAGRAAKERRVIRVNDPGQIQQVGKHVAHCIISAPLLHGGQVVGVMTLTNKTKLGPEGPELDVLGRFGEADEDLLRALADQAAANITRARLYAESTTDRMTALANFRRFEEEADAIIDEAHRSGAQVSLVMADIDRFKLFNDTHGHLAGDEVLKAVAGALQDVAEQHEGWLACRYGGEEFALVVPGAGLDEAAMAAEKFRVATSQLRVPFEENDLTVTISAGVAELGDAIVDRISLFQAADRALYAAKEAGRNRVCMMTPDGVIEPLPPTDDDLSEVWVAAAAPVPLSGGLVVPLPKPSAAALDGTVISRVSALPDAAAGGRTDVALAAAAHARSDLPSDLSSDGSASSSSELRLDGVTAGLEAPAIEATSAPADESLSVGASGPAGRRPLPSALRRELRASAPPPPVSKPSVAP